MLTIEFHCHTVFSKDSITSPEHLLATCKRKGIDRVVITDHNNIAGAQRCKELDPQRIIVGEEIMTTDGELLAAFVQEEVPKGLPPLEAISRLREQGAFISVSHPFDAWRKGGWSLAGLKAIVPLVDAIEVFNARCISPDYNSLAQAFARQHDLLGTVGSDAHAALELGRATLLLPEFNDPASLKIALRQAQRRVRISPPWFHMISGYARWVKSLRRWLAR
jgi:predicted metal-dependent phosphoesterase TrpH